MTRAIGPIFIYFLKTEVILNFVLIAIIFYKFSYQLDSALPLNSVQHGTENKIKAADNNCSGFLCGVCLLVLHVCHWTFV